MSEEDRRRWVEETARRLGPWRHDIDLGEFSTFDVAEHVGPFRKISHPLFRAKYIHETIPNETETVLDLGCNAGGISFYLEDREDFDITGVDISDDREVECHPLSQAWFCKHVRDSDVRFIEYDVLDFLSLDVSYDVIIAAGILYHVRSNGDRNEEKEKEFVDLLIEATDMRFYIETDPTPWLYGYIEENVEEITMYQGQHDTPRGIREFIAGRP